MSICVREEAEEAKIFNLQSLALSDRGSYYNQDEWLVEDTSPFCEAAEQQQKITEVYIQTFLSSGILTLER